MKLKCLLILSLLIVSSVAHASKWCVDGQSCNVSIVQLLTFPEKYNNKTVTVRAFFEIENSRAGIYLDKEKQSLGLSEYGIEIKLTSKQLAHYQDYHKQYVHLHGRFKDIKFEEAGFFSDAIDSIDTIHVIK